MNRPDMSKVTNFYKKYSDMPFFKDAKTMAIICPSISLIGLGLALYSLYQKQIINDLTYELNAIETDINDFENYMEGFRDGQKFAFTTTRAKKVRSSYDDCQ